jgi:hypothetical protein
MLLRFTLSAAGAMVLASTATAQLQTAKASPINTQVKDAGVYHVASGTWTRGLSAAALAGPETLYDNTCDVGYYWGMTDGDTMIDSGRVPSLSSPNSASSLVGTHDLYEIDCFSIAYCSFEPTVTSLDVNFIDCYAACDTTGGLFPTPVATFNLVNVPAGTAGGAQGCWIITLDLSNGGGAFNLAGDCNGTYNNTASTDSFGWSFTQSIPTTGSNTGPIFGGDPANNFPDSSGVACAGLGGGTVGGGTTFPLAGAAPGSGIGALDQMDILGGPTAPGCYWFGGYGGLGGNPFSAFYLVLQGAEGFDVPDNSGTPACLGDGTGNACPCANFGAAGAGCANSGGTGATLTGSGNASFANDTLVLTVTGVNGAKPGLIIRGNNLAGGGGGAPIGAGLICAVGGSQRSAVQVTDASGTTAYTTWDGTNGLGSVANMGADTHYQFWYRDPMNSPCAGTDFNFTGAISVTYNP